MARTHLFRQLKRALAPYLRESARRAAAPPNTTRASRRQLLSGGAALAALGCGPEDNTAPPSQKPRPHRIVVVGAGLSGLHCAYRLAKAIADAPTPISLAVYEANARVGGRIYTERSAFGSGEVACELGAEFIDAGHDVMRALAREFMVPLTRRSDLVQGTPENLFYLLGEKRAPELIAAQYEAAADVLGEAIAEMKHDAGALQLLDNTSLAEWLRVNLSGDAHAPIATLLAVACRVEFGLEPAEQSVLNLLHHLSIEMTTAFSPYADANRSFYAADGNDALLKEMELALKEQEQLKLDSRLRAVRVTDSDGERSYTLTFQSDGVAAFEVVADRVVFALPFSVLRQLEPNVPVFSETKWRVIKELAYGSSSKLVAQFPSRFWRQPAPGVQGAAGIISDLGFQQLYEAAYGSTILVNTMGGNRATQSKDQTVAQSMDRLRVELESMLPSIAEQFRDATAIRMDWNASQFSRGGRSCPRPGQWSLREAAGKRDGNLHFCGEHCSLDYPGTMEGAARTGALVAAEILDDLHLPYPEKLRELLESVPIAQKNYGSEPARP